MNHSRVPDQLELFDILQPPAPQRKQALGVLQVHLRHDQAIISGIAALIGLTVVFAMGVERGKQIVRVDREGGAHAVSIQAVSASETSLEGTPETAHADRTPVKRIEPAVSPVQKQAVPIELTPSGYAVQVVTYTRKQLAQTEMKRLEQDGEDAFIREYSSGHAVLYVGPFVRKDVAKEKSVALKSRYHDCFVKTL